MKRRRPAPEEGRPADPSPRGDERPWRSTGTVLLVDDEETIRAVGRSVLERAGLRVLTAADGLAAVELFRAEHEAIRLVILDVIMPRMDGERALREIRSLSPSIPVLLASGYVEKEAMNRLLGRDAVGFLEKPYRARQLLEAVRGALAE